MTWASLAADADRMAIYEESQGRFGGVHRNKAEAYRRAEAALELETSTGKPHCVCCLKPLCGRAP